MEKAGPRCAFVINGQLAHFAKVKIMATFDMVRSATSTTFGVSGIVGTVIGKIATWNDARQTRNALSQLTARELEDIGLIPGDIDAITGK